MVSDSGNQSPKIPASGWVLVLVALGAFWAKDFPLQGSRPNDQQSRSDKYQSLQDVDARLWQDPLAVIERAGAADRDKARSGGHDDIHSPCAIGAKLADRGGGDNKTAVNELTILAVMVPGGPYSENAESRAAPAMPSYRVCALRSLSPITKIISANSELIPSMAIHYANQTAITKPTKSFLCRLSVSIAGT